jgi:hypothetical protein
VNAVNAIRFYKAALPGAASGFCRNCLGATTSSTHAWQTWSSPAYDSLRANHSEYSESQ